MIKKIVIFLSFLIFITVLTIVFFKLKNSTSPFTIPHISSTDNNRQIDFQNIQLIPPFVSDSSAIWSICAVDTHTDTTSYWLAAFQPFSNRMNLIYNTGRTPCSLSGVAYDEFRRLFKTQSTQHEFNFFLFEKDSIIASFPPPETTGESLNAFALIDGIPECITLTDSFPRYFKRYTCDLRKDNQWILRPIKVNPFFARISNPIAAYFRNSWHFMATSDYYRRDSLYIANPTGTTNVMIFRSNYAYHFEDIRVEEPSFNARQIDFSFTGMLHTQYSCNDKYTFNSANLEFHKQHCSEHTGNDLPVFSITRSGIERFNFFENHESDKPVYTAIINEDAVKIIPETNDNTKKTVFYLSKDDKYDVAQTTSDFEKFYVIPFGPGYTLILDNGMYCKFDPLLNRTDNISFYFKVKSFIQKYFRQLLQSPGQFSSYTVPVIFTGLPFLILLALFVFFIVRVFLTPKRPAYSSRKQKKVPFSAYLLPAALLYVISTGIFIINFVSLLKFI